MNNIKKICKAELGSRGYGLATPTSDRDEGGIFLHLDRRYIIGLDRFEHIDKKGDIDSFYWELRHFLNMVKKCNTQALEILFNKQWLDKTPEFDLLQSARFDLLDSEKFFKSIKGYCWNEFRLVTGQRTGLLGSRRKNDLEKHGYSYRNLVQFLRLCWAGQVFFNLGHFPVNVFEYDKQFGELLMSIKTKPEEYNLQHAENLMINAEENLNKAFDNRKFDYKFNEAHANDICCQLYKPLL